MPERSWTFQLPKRDAPITLNSRAHWAVKASETRMLRWDSKLLAMSTHAKVEAIHVRLLVYPPDRRRRDDDNLVAVLKPIKDGLVDGLRLPDDTPEYVSWDPPRFAGQSFDGAWRYVVELIARPRGTGREGSGVADDQASQDRDRGGEPRRGGDGSLRVRGGTAAVVRQRSREGVRRLGGRAR